MLAAVLLTALAHAVGIWPIRIVSQIELAIGDARLRALMPRTLDPRVVIVDVDEKSVAEIGRWPWARDQLASLSDELFARQKAAVVGFDMVFAEPDVSSGLPALERLAVEVPSLAVHLRKWRTNLDQDARFARALTDRSAVLGFYLTTDRGARQVGVLPAPIFDAGVLQGRRINVTLADGYAANLPLLARAAPIAGYFNNLSDADGVVRRVSLVTALGGRLYEPLALAMLRSYTGLPAVVPRFSTGAWLTGAWLKDGYTALQGIELRQGTQKLDIPVDAHARVHVPFRGPGGPNGGSFEYVSASDLLNGRIPAAHLAGKLVLVGSTAPGIYDQRSTPVAEVYPGVEVHASLLSGLLDGHVAAEPDWSDAYEIVVLLVTAALLITLLPRLRPIGAAQVTLLLSAVLVAQNLWCFHAYGLVLPLATPLLLAALIYFGSTLWGYVFEGNRRRSLAHLFGSYVPPELVEEMAHDPARYDMRAENRVLTVMFCDMRNFTRVSEQLAPEEVRGLVNLFFSTMTAIIREHRGTLDKYIGDAVMAFWGAPLADSLHATHAVHAAQAMALRLITLNVELRERGLPEIGVGIGLNSGLVCVGDMGSSMRRSYTVMGDAVNLASRIEALTRHYGVDVLVGEATRSSAVATSPNDMAGMPLAWVEVDRVRVKGKQQCVTLFTPASSAVAATPSFRGEMEGWQLVLHTYRLQHWDSAQTQLEALSSQFAGSPFAGIYRQLAPRIEHYRRFPPGTDWDGAHTYDTK